jgi:hypothetical protein
MLAINEDGGARGVVQQYDLWEFAVLGLEHRPPIAQGNYPG